jgi:hypothetical protein
MYPSRFLPSKKAGCLMPFYALTLVSVNNDRLNERQQMISLSELKTERNRLQNQVTAIDGLLEALGGEMPVPFAKQPKAAAMNHRMAAPRRIVRRRRTGARNGPTTNDIILKALESGKDVPTKTISKACVDAGKSKSAVSVALNTLRKSGKVKHGAGTGFWKRA